MRINNLRSLGFLGQSPEGKLHGYDPVTGNYVQTPTENIYPFRNAGGLQNSVVDPTTVASTTNMPKPKALVTTVSGTAAIGTIDIPWPGFTGFIRYIPTGAFTGTTGATSGTAGTAYPIGLAFTAVVGKVLDLTFDGQKWYPSYVS